MKQWLSQVGKRGLFVAGLLAIVGFIGAYLVRQALQGMDVETSSIAVPILYGLVLGGCGFALVVVFEVIGAVWNTIFPKKKPDPEEPPPIPLFPWQQEDPL